MSESKNLGCSKHLALIERIQDNSATEAEMEEVLSCPDCEAALEAAHGHPPGYFKAGGLWAVGDFHEKVLDDLRQLP